MPADEIPPETAILLAHTKHISANLMNLVFMMADAATRSGIDGTLLCRHAVKAIAANQRKNAADKRSAGDTAGAIVLDEATADFELLIEGMLGRVAPRH